MPPQIRSSSQEMEWWEWMSLNIFIRISNVFNWVCVSMGSDAVLSSHGHPLPHGWFLQRGEGQLWEVQTLRSQTLSSARHRTRQGLSSFWPLSPSPSSSHVNHSLCDSALVQVRVGLIQFGSTPRLEFALDSHTTKQELNKHMKKVSYRFVSPLNLLSDKSCFLVCKRLYRHL